MEKRNVGQRAKILFDSLDLRILELLVSNSKGLQVLELTKKLKIMHNNLKPHIDKLIFLDGIRKENKEGRLFLTSDGLSLLKLLNMSEIYSKKEGFEKNFDLRRKENPTTISGANVITSYKITKYQPISSSSINK